MKLLEKINRYCANHDYFPNKLIGGRKNGLEYVMVEYENENIEGLVFGNNLYQLNREKPEILNANIEHTFDLVSKVTTFVIVGGK